MTDEIDNAANQQGRDRGAAWTETMDRMPPELASTWQALAASFLRPGAMVKADGSINEGELLRYRDGKTLLLVVCSVCGLATTPGEDHTRQRCTQYQIEKAYARRAYDLLEDLGSKVLRYNAAIQVLAASEGAQEASEGGEAGALRVVDPVLDSLYLELAEAAKRALRFVRWGMTDLPGEERVWENSER